MRCLPRAHFMMVLKLRKHLKIPDRFSTSGCRFSQRGNELRNAVKKKMQPSPLFSSPRNSGSWAYQVLTENRWWWTETKVRQLSRTTEEWALLPFVMAWMGFDSRLFEFPVRCCILWPMFARLDAYFFVILSRSNILNICLVLARRLVRSFEGSFLSDVKRNMDDWKLEFVNRQVFPRSCDWCCMIPCIRFRLGADLLNESYELRVSQKSGLIWG